MILLNSGLFRYAKWAMKYWVRREEYDEEAKLYLIRKHLGMSESQFHVGSTTKKQILTKEGRVRSYNMNDDLIQSDKGIFNCGGTTFILLVSKRPRARGNVGRRVVDFEQVY